MRPGSYSVLFDRGKTNSGRPITKKSLEGTPAEREEVGREVSRVISEAALDAAAKAVRHPCCCGRREGRGSLLDTTPIRAATERATRPTIPPTSPTDLAHGWQFGRGMIGSTARQRVGLRLKGPGRHWCEPGTPAVSALAVTPLRANDLDGHWHQLWNTLTPNC